jgi:hypothetical protein
MPAVGGAARNALFQIRTLPDLGIPYISVNLLRTLWQMDKDDES